MRIGVHGPVVLFLLIVCSCKKSDPDPSPPDDTPLAYSDTLFFLKNQTGEYLVSPVSRPTAPGYFTANPIGLALDSLTGEINISQSETGLRYKVYYYNNSNEVVDSTKLVISGIEYADGIYELPATPRADTAFPVYNARPELTVPCPPGDDDDDDDDDDDGGDDDDDDDDGSPCVFDETDLNGDGNDDIAGVIQEKLLVNRRNGTIDLEASFEAGIFGSTNPANGVSKDFTLYYRLNDLSNRALNNITVRIYHFKKRSDIPQEILNELETRRAISAEVNSNITLEQFGSSVGTTIISSNSVASVLQLKPKPKRPPMIIIVSQR